MSTWRTRLVDEAAELEGKLTKLLDFLESAAAKDIDPEHLALLRDQNRHMADYLEVLQKRIALLKPAPVEPERWKDGERGMK